jgi:hypothetical protein
MIATMIRRIGQAFGEKIIAVIEFFHIILFPLNQLFEMHFNSYIPKRGRS